MIQKDEDLNLFFPVIRAKVPEKNNEVSLIMDITFLSKVLLRVILYLEDKSVEALFTQDEVDMIRNVQRRYYTILEEIKEENDEITPKT